MCNKCNLSLGALEFIHLPLIYHITCLATPSDCLYSTHPHVVHNDGEVCTASMRLFSGPISTGHKMSIILKAQAFTYHRLSSTRTPGWHWKAQHPWGEASQVMTMQRQGAPSELTWMPILFKKKYLPVLLFDFLVHVYLFFALITSSITSSLVSLNPDSEDDKRFSIIDEIVIEH